MGMMQPKDTLGKRIRALRKQAELSQGELSRMVGISMQGIGQIERDEVHDPHLSTLAALASALGTTVGGLVDEPSTNPPDGPGSVAILDQVREYRRRMHREKKARARVERLAKNRFKLNPSEVIVLTQMLYYEENPPPEDGIMVMGHVKKKDEPVDYNELRKILLTLIEEGVLTEEETSAAAASIRAAL